MSDTVRAWLDHTHKLDQAATPGPWYEFETGVGSRAIPDDEAVFEDRYMCRGSREWIVHARTALPQATAAIRAVLDQLDKWDQHARQLQGDQGATSRVSCRLRAVIAAELTSHQHPTPPGSSGKCNHEARGITWAEGNTTAYACHTCEHEWTETR